jgi:hypothetical protein
MTKIEALLGEWKDKKASFHAYMHGKATHIDGRKDIEIARDILALAGEQRPGQVIVADAYLKNEVISDISRRIIDANYSLQGWYGNPTSQGIVTNGAGLPLFCEDLRMANRMSAIEWASLPLPG